jgi:Autophagy-related protein 101
VIPEDVECEGFNLSYARIADGSSTSDDASSNVRQRSNGITSDVDQAIDHFLQHSLSQIGPELMSGCLSVRFFERRRRSILSPSSGSTPLAPLIGWLMPPATDSDEKIVWEEWYIRAVINNTPRPIGNDVMSMLERQRIQDTGENMLRAVLLHIYNVAAGGGATPSLDRPPAPSGNHPSFNSLDHVPPVIYEYEITATKNIDDRESMYARVAALPPLLNLNA